MLILIKMILVLALMVILLKKKIPFGNAMLIATLFLFVLTEPTIANLTNAILRTGSKPGTWFMLCTLYFVMCLEYLLRTSGVLKGFTAAARKLFGSDRVLLGFMPAFLGFLPSMGGAIFSAPLVKEAAKNYPLTPERLTAINYWFRHIWEFSNPIIPAILLASEITKVPVSALSGKMFAFTVASAIIGIIVLLTGKPYRSSSSAASKELPKSPALKTDNSLQTENINVKTAIRNILLAVGPIAVNLILVVLFKMNTALAMALVLSGMAVILRMNLAKFKEMLFSAFNFQMLWGVLSIIFFQQMLETTGTIDQIVLVFESSGIPPAAIIWITAFIVGLLVGSPQGYVAIALPLVAPLTSGNMDVIALTFIAGNFGTMASPAHLCQVVSYQYFNADFLKSLMPIVFMQVILVFFAAIYIYLF
ncbi:MAG TPA: DUF401 family protein [Peptococcaceae bacterium]|nr:DUF401 family protein [Peptococcaceae bacterium]